VTSLDARSNPRLKVGLAVYNRDLPNSKTPGEILRFVQACLSSGRVRWTYHVTMRLQERRLTGDVLCKAAPTLEIVEEYPDDKYLPSFLLRGEVPEFVFHALVATDIEGDNIRVVTMYIPDPGQWAKEGRSRRISK
jgi:hypothetical protein